jgi:hypothetical protein
MVMGEDDRSRYEYGIGIEYNDNMKMAMQP